MAVLSILRNIGGGSVDILYMSSEEYPEEGRYVWRAGRVTYEAMLVVDGVVVLCFFLALIRLSARATLAIDMDPSTTRSGSCAVAALLFAVGCDGARLPPEPPRETQHASPPPSAPASSPAASSPPASPPAPSALPGDATCAKLPAGYAYRPSVGAHAREDHITLVPPFTVRAERHATGGGTSRCDIQLSECGADNTWTSADVIGAITHSAVVAALAAHATVYGDVSHGDAFVLERGADTLTVGRPCASGGGATCTPIPEPVKRLVDILNGIYRYRMVPPECSTL